MTTADETTKPLYGLQIGSFVPETGKFILPPVIDGSITKTIVQSQEWKSMGGRSSYDTKEMNQGSFGLSGSYGFSGLSRVDAAVSAYGVLASQEIVRAPYLRAPYQGSPASEE